MSVLRNKVYALRYNDGCTTSRIQVLNNVVQKKNLRTF